MAHDPQTHHQHHRLYIHPDWHGHAPARAQSGDEIGRALAGAIAFFVVGNVIASALDGKGTGSGKPKAVSTSKSKQYGNYWDIPKQGRPDRGRFGEHRHKVLPRHCFFVINHRGQRVGVFGQKCLSEFLHKSKWLPRACVRTIPVRNGYKASVYHAQCLRDHGYRVAQWRDR